MDPSQPVSPLLEREAQLAAADVDLHRLAAGTGRVMLLEGPAGIGKTALLAAIGERARGFGVSVHHASGDDLLSSLPYGVATRLLLPAVSGLEPAARRALMDGPARLGVELLRGVSAGVGSAGGPLEAASVGYSLRALVEELASASPRLLVVDDVHWADVPSVRALVAITRDVDRMPVLVVVAARPDPPAEVGDLLTRLVDQPQVLAPLGERAVTVLAEQALGAAVPESLMHALHEATSGNPFLVRELLVALGTSDWSGVEWDATGLGRLAPAGIRRFVLRRLAAAGEHAQRLARAVAVFGAAQLRDAARLADLDEVDAVAAADRLAAADVVKPGTLLSFVHPILRDTVRSDIPVAHRALFHATAARILADGGAPPEQVSTHLLEALPRQDAWAAQILVTAATRARERGSPETAVALLVRALAEPPPVETRSAVAVELGTIQAALGRHDAVATLDQAIEWATNPAERTAAMVAKARALFMVLDTRRVTGMLDELGSDLDAADPDVLLSLEGELVGSARLDPETRGTARARLERLRDRALPPRPATVAILANLAVAAAEDNQAAEQVMSLARLALHGGWLVREGGNQVARVINALTWVDQLDEAVDVADQVLAESLAAGSVITSTMAYTVRARADLRRGAVAAAEADAGIAHSLALEHRWEHVLPFTAAHLADALICRGALDEAAEVLADPAHHAAHEVPDYLDSYGRLELARHDASDALELFLACGRQLTSRGGVDAPGIVPWRSHAALASVGLGDISGARRLAADELELAERSSVAGAISEARVALGVATGGAEGRELLQQAVDGLAASPRVLSHIGALVELGAMIRRSGQARAARAHLAKALDLATQHGATMLAARARTELAAAGARPRRAALTGVDALTATERRVAELVGAGLTNRQIAQHLYVSARTITTHLTRIHQKLGVDGRDEIGAALAAGNIRPP